MLSGSTNGWDAPGDRSCTVDRNENPRLKEAPSDCLRNRGQAIKFIRFAPSIASQIFPHSPFIYAHRGLLGMRVLHLPILALPCEGADEEALGGEPSQMADRASERSNDDDRPRSISAQVSSCAPRAKVAAIAVTIVSLVVITGTRDTAVAQLGTQIDVAQQQHGSDISQRGGVGT